MDWFPHYIDPYDADTLELTLEQDAIYHRLLRWYYKHERPLPASEIALASICRIGVDKWREVGSFVVTRYYRVSHNEHKKTDELSHDKCNAVIVAQTQHRRDAKTRQEKHRKNNVIEAPVTRDKRVSHAAIGEDRIGEESKKVSKRGKIKMNVPSDWKPTEKDREYANSKRPVSRLNFLIDGFRNYHAAKGSLFADISAAWRTWVNNDTEWNPDAGIANKLRNGTPPGKRPGPVSHVAIANEIIAEMEELNRTRGGGQPASGGTALDAGLGASSLQTIGTYRDSETADIVTIDNSEQKSGGG